MSNDIKISISEAIKRLEQYLFDSIANKNIKLIPGYYIEFNQSMNLKIVETTGSVIIDIVDLSTKEILTHDIDL